MELHIYDVDYVYYSPEITELFHESPAFEMSLGCLMNPTKKIYGANKLLITLLSAIQTGAVIMRSFSKIFTKDTP